MKSDLDRLMAESDLDALYVRGSSSHNPSLTYFTGKAHLTTASILKRRGEAPILIHQPMERDEAANTGLQTQDVTEFKPAEIMRAANGDAIELAAELNRLVFEKFDVAGRVGIYGMDELGPSYAMLRRLDEKLSGIEIVGESERIAVLTRARATKSPDEIEQIRSMGELTVRVVGNIADFLTSQQVHDEKLIDADGAPITVGNLKRRIDRWLAEAGAENPKGTIFALGHDAGVPHSAGADDDVIQLGTAIVFDIFPSQTGGGYFYDFTRTWSLGYASDDVLSVYQDVAHVYNTVFDALEMDGLCRQYQVMTCELFEERGHVTVMQDASSQEGYVHALGHGLGLNVHEAPSFGHLESNDDRLLAGTITTFEPGLYYPDRNLGVRIEDTLHVQANGVIAPLATYPHDLVLEMQS